MEILKNFVKILTYITTLIMSIFIPKDKSIVIFSSGMNKFEGNSKYIFLYMNKKTKLRCYWLTVNKDLAKESNAYIYSYSLKGILTIVRAFTHVFTIDPREALPGMYLSGKKVYIQTYHGIPLKTLGMNASGVYNQRKISRQIKSWKKYILTSSSNYVSKLFKESFGVDDGNIILTGSARNDGLFKKIDKQELLEKVGVENLELDAKVILYAPTFRDNGKVKLFPFDNFNWNEFNDFLTRNNFLMLVRMHPLHNDVKNCNSERDNRIFFVSSDLIPDTQELLNITDLLITDYSSVYFDYLILNRPMIFLPYDYEIYKSTRGFSMDYYENTPGPKVVKLNKFLEEIETNLKFPQIYEEERKKCNVKFNFYNDGNSSKRISQFIVEKIKNLQSQT